MVFYEFALASPPSPDPVVAFHFERVDPEGPEREAPIPVDLWTWYPVLVEYENIFLNLKTFIGINNIFNAKKMVKRKHDIMVDELDDHWDDIPEPPKKPKSSAGKHVIVGDEAGYR